MSEPRQDPGAPRISDAAVTQVLIATNGRRGRWVSVLSWFYAALVLLALGLIRCGGGQWWGAIALLFVPRWLFLAPLAILAFLSLWSRNLRGWVVQGASALVVLGPLMGLNTPIRHLIDPPSVGASPPLRVVSYNLSLFPIRDAEFRAWVEQERVDVICFQEGGREEDAIRRSLREAGWHVSKRQMVVSRFQIVEELPAFPEQSESDERYTALLERVRLAPPRGPRIVVASLHLPTLRKGIEHLIDEGDPTGLTRHREWWSHELARVLSALAEVNDAPLLVAGDFNMPADDATMAALKANFRFAFEETGWGYGYTRPAAIPWVRIDHILAGPDWRVLSCGVGPDFGSDHRPLIAKLAMPGP
jgi:vancomycin resistance protein VanJ